MKHGTGANENPMIQKVSSNGPQTSRATLSCRAAPRRVARQESEVDKTFPPRARQPRPPLDWARRSPRRALRVYFMQRATGANATDW